MLDGLEIVDPARVAVNTIRGYVYQMYLGVQRWLELEEGEILLCEGDEDLDRRLGTEDISEQVKDYRGTLNITDRAVSDSVKAFLRTFKKLREDGETRSFVFTTTASRRDQRGNVDVLDSWNDRDQREAIITHLRGLRGEADTKESQAIDWLDADELRWDEFFNSVKWVFDAPGIDEVREDILRKLQEIGREASAEHLRDRLLVAVLEASFRPDVELRALTRDDLDRVLDASAVEIEQWIESHGSARLRNMLREVVDERIQEQQRQLDADAVWALLDTGEETLSTDPHPGELLRAGSGVVAFLGREAELADLESWWAEDVPISVYLLTGSGGSGKTRLALEFSKSVRTSGCFSGFVTSRTRVEDVPSLFLGTSDRLLVLDYAETRIDVLTAVLAEASRKPELKTRLLLVARNRSEWWEKIGEFDAGARRLIETAVARHLSPLSADHDLRDTLFETSAASFSHALGVELPATDRPDLHDPRYDLPLYVVIAALIWVKDGEVPTDVDLLDVVLEHEQRFWLRAIDALGLPDRPSRNGYFQTIELSVTLITLYTGIERGAALSTLVSAVSQLPEGQQHLDTCCEVIEQIYAVRSLGRSQVRGVEPDLLGEQLVIRVQERTGNLLQTAVGSDDADRLHSTLTVLTRIAQRTGNQDLLSLALNHDVENLAGLAIGVALETGDPIGIVLASALENVDDPDFPSHLVPQLPEDTVALREVAIVATRSLLGWNIRTYQNPTTEVLVDRANLHSNLANRLRDLKHLEAAREHIEAAIGISSELFEEDPERHRELLGSHFLNQGAIYASLGGLDREALISSRSAVDLFRPLYEEDREGYGRKFSRVLNNTANRFDRVERYAESLTLMEEAEVVAREAIANHGERALPELGIALIGLGIALRKNYRFEDALPIQQESVDVVRRLVEQGFEGFLPDTGRTLHNLSLTHRDLGQRESALATAMHATEAAAQLAVIRPEVFEPTLATYKSNLAVVMDSLDRVDDARREHIDALSVFAPWFIRTPLAHGNWMHAVVRAYREFCDSRGLQPDEEILAPIEEVLSTL